jgi:hypothetical protein
MGLCHCTPTYVEHGLNAAFGALRSPGKAQD